MTQDSETTAEEFTNKDFNELTDSIGAALSNLIGTYEIDGTLGYVIILRHENEEGGVAMGMASNGKDENVIELLEQLAVRLRNATPENSVRKEHKILLPH